MELCRSGFSAEASRLLPPPLPLVSSDAPSAGGGRLAAGSAAASCAGKTAAVERGDQLRPLPAPQVAWGVPAPRAGDGPMDGSDGVAKEEGTVPSGGCIEGCHVLVEVARPCQHPAHRPWLPLPPPPTALPPMLPPAAAAELHGRDASRVGPAARPVEGAAPGKPKPPTPGSPSPCSVAPLVVVRAADSICVGDSRCARCAGGAVASGEVPAAAPARVG